MNKTFVISLKRHKERQKAIAEYFKKYDLKYDIWYGVDGREEDINKYDISRKTIQRFWHNPISCCSYTMILSDTEYACALSHIKIYEYIVKNNIPFTTIFEDDIYPTSIKTTELITNVDKIYAQYKFDILYLFHNDKLKSFSSEFKIDDFTFLPVGVYGFDWLFNRRRVVYSTCCYTITLEGAKKLLAKAYPVRMPADTLTGLMAFNKLKALKSMDNLVGMVDIESSLDRIKKTRPWYKEKFHHIRDIIRHKQK